MTTKQITGIVVRFLVIYLLFSVLLGFLYNIPQIAFRIDSPPEATPSLWTLLFVPLIGIITCLGVLFILWKTSTSLLSNTEEESVKNNLTVAGLMQTIFSCMGVYFLINGILAFLGVYASARSNAQFTAEDFYLNPNWLIVPIVQIIFGAMLIAKPKKWARAIKSIGEK